MKILIADDDLGTRKLVRKAVEADGVSISEAENGAQALDVVFREKPDLVVLDIYMPLVDGEEVLKQIRMNDEVKNAIVIITSAVATRSKVVSIIKKGVDAYVLKPIGVPDLREKVQSLIDKKRSISIRPTGDEEGGDDDGGDDDGGDESEAPAVDSTETPSSPA